MLNSSTVLACKSLIAKIWSPLWNRHTDWGWPVQPDTLTHTHTLFNLVLNLTLFNDFCFCLWQNLLVEVSKKENASFNGVSWLKQNWSRQAQSSGLLSQGQLDIFFFYQTENKICTAIYSTWAFPCVSKQVILTYRCHCPLVICSDRWIFILIDLRWFSIHFCYCQMFFQVCLFDFNISLFWGETIKTWETKTKDNKRFNMQTI